MPAAFVFLPLFRIRKQKRLKENVIAQPGRMSFEIVENSGRLVRPGRVPIVGQTKLSSDEPAAIDLREREARLLHRHSRAVAQVSQKRLHKFSSRHQSPVIVASLDFVPPRLTLNHPRSYSCSFRLWGNIRSCPRIQPEQPHQTPARFFFIGEISFSFDRFRRDPLALGGRQRIFL
jgi:hypothetical protein